MLRSAIALFLLVVLAAAGNVHAQTFTFQQGVDGYSGVLTGLIAENEPDSSFQSSDSGDDRLSVDLENNEYGLEETRALVRFDDIVGGSGIPANATVVSAELTVQTVSFSDGPVTIGWLDGTFSGSSTWNSLGGGGSFDFTEDMASNIVDDSPITFDVTDGVQSVVNGGTNAGWLFTNSSTDGWDFCSELPVCDGGSSAGLTPLLTVTIEGTATGASTRSRLCTRSGSCSWRCDGMGRIRLQVSVAGSLVDWTRRSPRT